MHYSYQEKQDVVNRYLIAHESVESIVRDTGIAKTTIYKWINQTMKSNEGSVSQAFVLNEYKRLEHRLQHLETIIAILQSVNCTAQSPLNVKLSELEKLHGKYSVHALCEALNVSRGTFYNHMFRNKRDCTWYSKHREDLRAIIQDVFDEYEQRCGSGKIYAILESRGIKTSPQMVRELMREMGLLSIRQGAKKFYEKQQAQYKNYLNQQFDVKKPNEVWVSDITQCRFKDKNYYLCVIIDLYARVVVASEIGRRNSTALVKKTIKAAYDCRQPKPGTLLFHTDRGTNYTSYATGEYLAKLGIQHSFSRAHVPYDNSVVESFFASLKREELYRRIYHTEREFLKAINDYIVFYNEKRPHTKIQNKIPVEYEIEYYKNSKKQ